MRKRAVVFLSIAMVLAMMLPLISASASGTEEVIGPSWVFAENGLPVKLRALPSQNSEILVKVPYGARLDSVRRYNDKWMIVQFTNQQGTYNGYMMSMFIVQYQPTYRPPVTPTVAPTQPITPVAPLAKTFLSMQKVDYQVVVAPTNGASYGNLRWAPSEDYPVMSIYYPGYQLRVLYTNGTWCQVLDETSGKCGFMRTFLVQPIQYGTTGTTGAAQ